jgi:hypothetical protein
MKIDAHPNKSQIDALLAAGVPLKEICSQIPDISVAALRRYRKKLTLLPPDDTSLETQLALWTQRANDLYIASGAQLDLRGQSQAVAAGFRALEFSLRNREKLADQAAREQPLDGQTFTPEESSRFVKYIDSVLEATENRRGDPPENRWFGMQITIGKHPDGNSLVDLVWRLLHDQPLLESVLQMTAPQEETQPGVVLAGIPGAN